MNRTLWIAASGMEAQQTRVDTIANNMANVSTTAYKKGIAQFQDMLYETFARPGSQSSNSYLPAGIQMGTGVMTATVSKYFGQGSLVSSSSDLDLAIEGEGFFQVQMTDGTSTYTRAGNLHMDAQGKVVTGEGYTIVGFPTLNAKATNITITTDGTVSYTYDGATTEAGRIQLARFPNPEGLSYEGYNLYSATEGSGNAETGYPGASSFGYLAQHYLENSNVEIVKEMVDMIAAQRAYELNSKSVKTAEEMLRTVVNLKV
ncbi:MAG: flagellar basal-body rod protein FlgG [Lentisphaerae bacterium GWF2_44_16]|nr:MAG: flagellar basal-body rod protein FlgG [Lentisphaerae bacterium GWF2_44_16]